MLRSLLLFAIALALLASVVPTWSQMHDHGKPSPALEQLKSLAGDWEGVTSENKPVKVHYTVVSNGSALMERLEPMVEVEMITMYTADGDHLVVTHYCSAGNQPTLQTDAVTGAPGKYDFHFTRLSGAKSPDEGHMVNLSVTMPDKDHLTQVWTFQDHGHSHSETFHFTRKS